MTQTIEQRREASRLRMKQARAEQPGHINSVRRAWRDKNKERLRQYEKNRRADPRFRAMKKAWRAGLSAERKAEIRAYTRARYLAGKMAVFNHYGNGSPRCECCGETQIEFLTIDHINGGGTRHRKEVGASNIYQWLINNKFPQGFRILCMNCNWALGKYGHCPHQHGPAELGESNA